jgi:alkylation response protein AidB-like acyl-CoA dehydrogenase
MPATGHRRPEPDRSEGADIGLLRSVLREFCVKQVGAARPRTAADGYDRALWRRMARELDLTGFSIPVEFGGAGFSWSQQAVVFEELGRTLAPLPYFASVAQASTALLSTPDDAAKARFLPALADGSRVGALAITDDSSAAPTTAVRAHGGYRLGGRKLFVLNAPHADLLLVTAQVDDACALFAVEASAPGVLIEPMGSLDLTRATGQVTMTEASAELIGEIGSAPSYLRRARDLANCALSAEQVGGIDRCLELSVTHAGERHQFGRAIGSFQAIKHRCVDMLVQLELARALTADACEAATAEPDTLSLAASAACAFATTAYRSVAAETIQVHGGMGFTWEHEAHLHFRRAYSNAGLHTSPRRLRENIADLCRANPAMHSNPMPPKADSWPALVVQRSAQAPR